MGRVRVRRFCIALLSLSALPANAGEGPANGNIPLRTELL